MIQDLVPVFQKKFRCDVQLSPELLSYIQHVKSDLDWNAVENGGGRWLNAQEIAREANISFTEDSSGLIMADMKVPLSTSPMKHLVWYVSEYYSLLHKVFVLDILPVNDPSLFRQQVFLIGLKRNSVVSRPALPSPTKGLSYNPNESKLLLR